MEEKNRKKSLFPGIPGFYLNPYPAQLHRNKGSGHTKGTETYRTQGIVGFPSASDQFENKIPGIKQNQNGKYYDDGNQGFFVGIQLFQAVICQAFVFHTLFY
jgi:hypothetical protein